MPYVAVLHTHITFVVLYVLVFLVKVILLLSNNTAALANFRKKTKIIEMILPLIFLGTGIYLAAHTAYPAQTWFIVKMVLLVVSIPLGIITFKRNSKALGILTLLIFLYMIGISYTKTLNFQDRLSQSSQPASGSEAFNPSAPGYDAAAHGQAVFTKMNCGECHGMDGTLGNAGAANLQTSKLSDDEIKTTIENGRKNMPAYKGHLNQDELNVLTAFVKSLRK